MRHVSVTFGWGLLALATSGGCGGDTKPTPDATVAPDVAADVTVDVASETTAPETVVDATVDEVEGPIVCSELAVTGELVANDAPGAFTLGGGRDLGFGGPLPDAVVLEFYTNATGTFDLSAGENDNYATCDQCVRIVQDIDPANPAKTRHFFQSGGTIIIDPTTPPESGRLSVELVDLELVEVRIFADYHTERLDRGDCYLRTAPLQLETAACVPSCGDHICGPDGCGGECGAGCATGVCNLDGKSCNATPSCHVMTLRGGELTNPAAGVYRLDTTDKGLGAIDDDDFLQLELYARSTGAFNLASTENADYATCKQCVRMVLDGKKEFFQAGGTLTLAEGSDPLGDPDAKPPGGALEANFDAVRLIEVTYDDETFHASPVDNGACIDLVVDQPLLRTLP